MRKSSRKRTPPADSKAEAEGEETQPPAKKGKKPKSPTKKRSEKDARAKAAAEGKRYRPSGMTYNTQAKKNAQATETLLTALGGLGGGSNVELNAAISLARQQLGKIFFIDFH